MTVWILWRVHPNQARERGVERDFGSPSSLSPQVSSMVSNKKQLARVKLIELSAPPLCPQKDLYHRINFSYQASIFFSQLDLKVPVGTETGRKGKRRAIDEENGENAEPRLSGLAWGGMGSTKKMAAHNQLKLYVFTSALIKLTEIGIPRSNGRFARPAPPSSSPV